MSDGNAEATVRICAVDDVAEGSPHVAEVDDELIAVFYADGAYFAVNNVCPHQGGPLAKGKVEEQCVYCPWHGWQFDLETGEHVHGLKTATTYDITLEDGEILLNR